MSDKAITLDTQNIQKSKLVPAIRFEGFSGAWEECSLSKFIMSLDAGVSVNSGEKSANENEFGILKTSCVTNGIFEPYENKIVFKTEEINRLKEPVLRNTIIISRMNTPTLVGANAYIDKSFDNYFLPDRLWAAKPTFIGDLKFVAYIIGSEKGRAALSELATGTSGSMKNISKPSVLKLKFHAPRKNEQTKIGNYFQQLDTLIAQHQKKHDTLLKLKKSLLEKLFPKQGSTKLEIRFKGFSEVWEEKKLKYLTKKSFSNGVFNDPNKVGRGYRLINVKDMYSGSSIDVDSLSLIDIDKKEFIKNKVEYGDIFFTRSSLVKEGIAYSNVNLSTHQALTFDGHLIRMQPCKRTAVPVFLSYSFRTKSVRNQFILGGKTTTMTTIGQSDIAEVKVAVPALKEQTKIGNLFKQLDTLIKQHQIQLKKLGNIKQACLAKMFV